MDLKTIAQTIDRLAQQELPSYEKSTRNIGTENTYQITRRTTLNNNQVHYEVIANSRGAQFAITDGQKYTTCNIPFGADEATITGVIAAARNIHNTNN